MPIAPKLLNLKSFKNTEFRATSENISGHFIEVLISRF